MAGLALKRRADCQGRTSTNIRSRVVVNYFETHKVIDLVPEYVIVDVRPCVALAPGLSASRKRRSYAQMSIRMRAVAID